MTDDDDTKARKRIIRHTACFDPYENAILLMKVQVAGVSISAFLKSSALHSPIPRGARHPTTSEQHVVQMLSEVGRLTTAFDRAVDLAAGLVDVQAVETAMRDQAEMRLVLLAALGVEP